MIDDICRPWLGGLHELRFMPLPPPPSTAAARSTTCTGVVGVLPASGGVWSIEEPELSNKRAPSPRRAARSPSALSRSLITYVIDNHQ